MPNYTRDQAREHIAQLVHQFQQSETTLLHTEEANIENNFVRPLFRYLNWNVDNTGLSEPHWEFVLQRTNRQGTRPDYILQLDGQRLFVMDAKKAKYDMHDVRWLNQVYAYAYSTQNNAPAKKIDFAILTDFQEFVVLDCTQLVKPNALATLRVLDWRYPDYVNRFDELWDLFERNNVRATLRERTTGIWARKLTTKQAKANRIPPDRAFLSALDDEKTGWRVLLAKDMKKNNPALGGAVLTAAVQLLIDRLIFVKVLSDREIEQDYLRQMADLVERDGLSENNRGWFAACKNLFAELNAMYNGSVFAPRTELEAVAVSNKVVRDIIGDLQPENSPYNFAVLPVEILGTIYERFLGRVVHATDARVKIEDKPEVRKAGGVYYTPQYIVEYIVKQTVGKLLADCQTPADAARLKILDPACGSGSFLLGAYAALLEWHRAYYATADRRRTTADAFYRDEDGRVRLTAKLKRQILLNNLFGVDIDPQAVEVTRMSLSLKALEDTRSDEAHHERTLFNQTLLPDLSANVKCGNSLIGTDYLCADDAELKRVKPFDWAREFADVFTPQPPSGSPRFAGGEKAAGLPPLSVNFPTGEGRGGGFDAVIGNPPYIRIQTMKEWAPTEVEFYKAKYTAASAGNYDIYVVFVERGLSLLNERGRMGFILPHKFFNSKYGEPLRGLIASGKHLGHVVHFGDQQIFDGATTYTCLMFLDKASRTDCEFVKVTELEAWRNEKTATTGLIPSTSITQSEWNFTVGKSSALFEKLSQMPVRLGDVSKIFVGIQTSADPIFILPLRQFGAKTVRVYSKATENEFEIEQGIAKQLLKGAEIHAYNLDEPKNIILFPYYIEGGTTRLISEREMQIKFPLAWAYLLSVRKKLEAREGGKWRVPQWWQFGRNQNIAEMGKQKLLTQVLAKRASFTLDADAEYCFVGGGNAGGYGVQILDSSKLVDMYILGLLNSHLLDWYLKKISTTFRGGFFSYARRFIERLPIRTINFADAADRAAHDQMVQFVERMLALHQSLASAQTETERALYQRQIAATDQAIDALVYRLYELTDDEIKLVEGK